MKNHKENEVLDINKHQFSLEGKDIEPWDGRCCSACWNAIYEKCVCRCGGKYHGAGHPRRAKDSYKRAMEDQRQNPPVLEAQVYKELITNPICRWCDYDLSHEPILGYDHSDGWKVEGIEKLQWLWITCPCCGYQHSLWKLGVLRDADATKAVTVNIKQVKERVEREMLIEEFGEKV